MVIHPENNWMDITIHVAEDGELKDWIRVIKLGMVGHESMASALAITVLLKGGDFKVGVMILGGNNITIDFDEGSKYVRHLEWVSLEVKIGPMRGVLGKDCTAERKGCNHC